MRYALFVHDLHRSWDDLSKEEKRARHHDWQAIGAACGVIAHYRLRPAKNVFTVRVEREHPVRSDGPLTDSRQTLHAIYIVDSDTPDFVFDLAGRIPAVQTGGIVEVW